MTTGQIKTILQQLKPELAKRYGLSYLALFGSYARQEETPESDIDLLVDFEKMPGLITFIQIEEELEAALHHRVDMVPKRKLKKEIQPYVQRDLIEI